MNRLVLFALCAALALCLALPGRAEAADVYTMKLSVDSNENHHRNKGLHVFIDLLEKNSQGKIKVEFFHSAQLYKDKDIPKALGMGTVDMGCPGIWQLEGVVPSTAITALPMFYGLPAKITKDLVDGEVGRLINEDIEKKLGGKVLGKWHYHGYLHFCAKPRAVKTLADFKGLKIRHHGGAANAIRLEALGASPILIPWPDLPMAMIQGTADGFVTTFKSFESAKLWETGTKFATKDMEYYLHNIPLVSGKFWKSLPADLQKIVLDTWEQHIETARQICEDEQSLGEKLMQENGVEIYYPTPAELMQWRARILPTQDTIVQELGLDKALVARVQKVVDAAMAKQ